MPSKSVKFWSSASLVGVAALAVASDAFATVTLTPVRLDGTELANVSSNTAYYPASLTESSTLFLDSVDTTMPPSILSLTASQSELATSRSNLIVLMVESDKILATPASPQQLVITLFAAGTAGTQIVPIAFTQSGTFSQTGGSSCSSSSYCQGSDIPSNSVTYYLAAQYASRAKVEIGIYPADICTYYSVKYGGSAYGCSGSTVLTAGGASTMQLTAQIDIATTAGAAGDTTKSQDSTATALSLVFETTGPTMTSANCPSSSTFYFPGDGQISIDATPFSASISTGAAPTSSLIVVANDNNGVPVRTSAYASSNSLYVRIPVGTSNQILSGFTNTTTGSDHQYQLGYMIRDYAGMVGIAPSGCTTSNVQTSSIPGFLKKSSCFIATAAYRDPDAAPVLMLREFRDRILLRHDWGQAFVNWYYDWSPSAAEWLMENPVFRYPVLVVLVPVELLAWCALHPDDAALAAIALAGVASLVRLNRRRETGRQGGRA